MAVGNANRADARIVYDEDRRGWLIEVGPEPGHAMLGGGRLLDSDAEAEEILRLRGYRQRPADGLDWPWCRIGADEPSDRRACVEDWVRSEHSKILTFEGDEP